MARLSKLGVLMVRSRVRGDGCAHEVGRLEGIGFSFLFLLLLSLFGSVFKESCLGIQTGELIY